MRIILEGLAVLVEVVWCLLVAAWRWAVPLPRKSLAGKTALVTGAAHGLGRELGLRLAALDLAHLILWDINKENLDKVCQEIRDVIASFSSPTKVTAQYVDVSSEAAVREAASLLRDQVGPVDVLINNAGIMPGLRFVDLTVKHIENTLKVNLFSHFWTIKTFLKGMISREEGGHIVAVASIAGLQPTVYMTDYCASKYGLVGFMGSLRMELRELQVEDRVHLTVVCPLGIDTGMAKNLHSRFGRLVPVLQPGPTADVILDAMLRNKEFIVIPTHIKLVTLILSMLPYKAVYRLLEFIGYGFDPSNKSS